MTGFRSPTSRLIARLAMGGLAYQTGWAGVTLGYRYLSYEQGGDNLLQDFSLGGPFLAVNFTF